MARATVGRMMTEEPTEPGWYAYSGGGQVMVFHLRRDGQWSVHLDNGTAAYCVWAYISQALTVWDLVRLVPGAHEHGWRRVGGNVMACRGCGRDGYEL